MKDPVEDRNNTIGVLDRQAKFSSDEQERKTLEDAAEILRKRNGLISQRGPADAGSPMDDKLTR